MTTFDTLMEGLTEPQRQAVEHIDGPLLVLAGPGSGKTTVVTRRVANLIANGIPAWQILALTFTNKAAGEMRDRIMARLPEDLPGKRGLTVATFHSFCARLLRRYAEAAGLSPNFTIYDSSDQREAIKRAVSDAGFDSKNFTPAAVASRISGAKNQLLDAEAYAQQAGDFYSRSIARIFQQYAKILNQNDAADFDDLLLRTAKMLKDYRAIREELQQRYQYLLIDEYQDTNHAQFVIAHSLAAAHKNICVVGDPDQSIYGWRGADLRNIMEFEQQYPEAAVIPLGQNFRSTAHIVKTADHLIRKNRERKHKDLHTELGDGEKPQVVTCRDEHHEAELIVDQFRRLNEGDGDIPPVPWREMAVLYRVNALSRVLEEEFREAQIPYVIARGTAFYDRKEIKDALAYLRMVANPNEEVSLRRIINTPTRGIGKTTLEKIEIFAIQNQLGLFDALRRVDEVQGLTSRAVSAVKKFVSMVEAWRAMEHGGGMLDLDGAERAPLAELTERILRESGMEAMYRQAKAEEEQERLENLEELINAAGEFVPQSAPDFSEVDAGGEADAGSEDARGDRAVDVEGEPPTLMQTLTAFLESVTLVSDADVIDPANGAVTLMTLHAAKGLEFDVVAMAGLEEGLLPHVRSLDSTAQLEEERRLCFVGITRARKHLMLSRAKVRTHRGMREGTVPSQFLRELPEEAIETLDMAGDDDFLSDGWDDAADDPFGDRPSPRPGGGGRQRTATVAATGSWATGGREPQFPVGCMVRHPKFGIGRVEGLTPRPAGTSARINFRGIGVKTLILQYAKLERVE